MAGSFVIGNARVIDPGNARDSIETLCIRDGVIADSSAELPADAIEIDAGGLIAAPAFVDLHVHFREPGGERSETIAGGCRTAARAGFGTVVPMPNTTPPLDTPARLRWQIEQAHRHSPVELIPSACITRGRQGLELSDLEALAAAGAAFFTDDGSTVRSDELMRAAMQRAAELDLMVVDHAQRSSDEQHGVMHAGRRSAELGFPGISSEAESEVVARDIELAEQTGCAVHIQHITSAAGVDLVRQAKARGVRVSAELTPHHLALCDEDVPGDDANFKMNPPLRSAADRAALRAGIVSGAIDCFATDHAPHARGLKQKGFLKAPFGVIGLETAIGVTYSQLVLGGELDVVEWIAKWTTEPRRLISRPCNGLQPGAPARLVLIDPAARWRVGEDDFDSTSHNSCFLGLELTARARAVILNGIYISRDT
jgi:dihydroorotase